MEGADALAGGEGAELGEDAPQRDVVAVVDTPGQHHVTAPGRQFAHRLVDGDQRGRARRVHGVRRSAQVQTARDPRRGEVRHQPDRRLRTVGPEPLGERLAYAVELPGGQVGQQLAECAHELARRPDPLIEPDQPGSEITAPAQHDADPLPVGQASGPARVVQRGGGHVQRDELVRFGAGDRRRHDPEPGHLHLGEPVHEPAASAVHAVRDGRFCGGAGTVVVGVPAAGGHFTDRVDAVAEVLPVGVEVGGAGEQHGHPHDGDRDLTTDGTLGRTAALGLTVSRINGVFGASEVHPVTSPTPCARPP